MRLLKFAAWSTCVILSWSVRELPADEICLNPQGPNDVVHCARKRHPEIQRQDLSIHRDQALKKIAGQRPNPDFTYETTFGEPEADTQMEGEISLGIPLELGGKRKARVKRAVAQAAVSQTKLRLLQEKIVLTTVVSLYRLRQITTEIDQINEALATFRQIEGQYRVRGILTPHQEVSQNIYQLALQDYEIRKTSLTREQNILLKRLRTATGLTSAKILRCLPSSRHRWPPLAAKTKIDSAQVAAAEHEHRLANTKRSLAQAQAWPDLKVGPLIKYEESQNLGFGYGFGVSLPLPVLNRNQGGKVFAAKDEMLAKRNVELSQQASRWDYDELRKNYDLAVRRLKASPNLGQLEQRHHRLHQHFTAGLVETSLVVETHRQIIDLTRDRNQLELATLGTLWSIYALEGRILKERI